MDTALATAQRAGRVQGTRLGSARCGLARQARGADLRAAPVLHGVLEPPAQAVQAQAGHVHHAPIVHRTVAVHKRPGQLLVVLVHGLAGHAAAAAAGLGGGRRGGGGGGGAATPRPRPLPAGGARHQLLLRASYTRLQPCAECMLAALVGGG